jgi:hypothetical protein
MAHPEALETYTRTIRTMSEVIENLRDKPDPDGSMTRLLDRITVEREWVRALMAWARIRADRPPGCIAPRRQRARYLRAASPPSALLPPALGAPLGQAEGPTVWPRRSFRWILRCSLHSVSRSADGFG